MTLATFAEQLGSPPGAALLISSIEYVSFAGAGLGAPDFAGGGIGATDGVIAATRRGTGNGGGATAGGSAPWGVVVTVHWPSGAGSPDGGGTSGAVQGVAHGAAVTPAIVVSAGRISKLGRETSRCCTGEAPRGSALSEGARGSAA